MKETRKYKQAGPGDGERNYIKIRGAKAHNLKNVSLDIPRDSLVVITGLSGSGKSSLAFDTLYAEGQRRYMDTLSPYAKHFMGVLEKPQVESIEGLSPVIDHGQKSPFHSRHHNRNLRLPAPALCQSLKSLFPCDGQGDGALHRRTDCIPDSQQLCRPQMPSARSFGERP